MGQKVALITGITGQDGSYLAELLLSKNYVVHGIIRRSSSFNTGRIDHIFDKLHLHYGDMTDPISLSNIIQTVQPHELYHLAAQSHVKVSFELPLYTGMADGIGTLSLLEAIKTYCPDCKLYNAATSELYGNIQIVPQNEYTPFYPRSPYGIAKLYSYWITKNYREAYGLFAVNGILFNHESPRRGDTFVTKKIIQRLVQIKRNGGGSLVLGNLEAKRDWGYAPEYVDGMWRMLQYHFPTDFVLSTGETHSIREFVDEACKILGLTNVDIVHDAKYDRPTEVNILLGDSKKAEELLGWKAKTKFKELIQIMIDDELNS